MSVYIDIYNFFLSHLPPDKIYDIISRISIVMIISVLGNSATQANI